MTVFLGGKLAHSVSNKLRLVLVSYAAAICVVTQRSSPLRCVTIQITAAWETPLSPGCADFFQALFFTENIIESAQYLATNVCCYLDAVFTQGMACLYNSQSVVRFNTP